METIRRCGLAFTLVLAVAQPVWAQAGAVGIGGGAGWAVPVAKLEDNFNDGPAWGAWITANLLENVDVQVLLQQSFFDERRESQFIFDTTDLTVTTVNVGPRVFLLDSKRPFRPWLAGGIGWTRLEADDAGPGHPVGDDDRFGFDLGGGFDFGRPSWAITIEARYYRNLGSGGEDDFGYVVPMGGFTFRFLP